MKKSNKLKIAGLTALAALGYGGYRGCNYYTHEILFGGSSIQQTKLPDFWCDLSYAPSYDSKSYSFECSSTKPIRKILLFHDGSEIELKINKTARYTLEGKNIEHCLGIAPENLAEGDYRFRIVLENGSSWETTRQFHVKPIENK